MDRVLLDANVLFSAAYRTEAGLLRLWKLPDIALCTSRYALEEARFNLADHAQRVRLQKLTSSLEISDAPLQDLPPGIKLPVKDAPILQAAIAARATHLLTGDMRHCGVYFGKVVGGVLILLPAQYLSESPR
jgi:uncharacterized protein